MVEVEPLTENGIAIARDAFHESLAVVRRLRLDQVEAHLRGLRLFDAVEQLGNPGARPWPAPDAVETRIVDRNDDDFRARLLGAAAVKAIVDGALSDVLDAGEIPRAHD